VQNKTELILKVGDANDTDEGMVKLKQYKGPENSSIDLTLSKFLIITEFN
jgi:hypothetical protein